MAKPDLVCWYMQWDKEGRVVQRLYRPRGQSDVVEASPAPEAAPNKPIVRRGVQRPIQGDLQL